MEKFKQIQQQYIKTRKSFTGMSSDSWKHAVATANRTLISQLTPLASSKEHLEEMFTSIIDQYEIVRSDRNTVRTKHVIPVQEQL